MENTRNNHADDRQNKRPASPSNIDENRKITNPPDMSADTDNRDTGPMAANPKLANEDVVPADSLPSEKNITSAIPGAEEEGNVGTASAGAGAVGTHGADPASEGRKGNPDNYGANQAGPGLATRSMGPVDTNQ